jgi:NAD(P)-dependent dehydrogenase (short-subunit alcohol dehydrogenase family)
VISLTRSLASQYAQQNIRANAICPGFVLSDRIRGRFGQGGEESIVGRTRSRYPFGVGKPVDIANVALFLLSDEACMVTGAILPADGGMSIY